MLLEFWAQYGRVLLIVCPLVFLGSFVDSIAGGGGLITLPAYLFAGLPVHMAAATNKFSACIGTIWATVRFFLSGKIILTAAVPAALGAIVGSPIGTMAALHISDRILNLILLIALPCVGVFMVLRRDLGKETGEKEFSARKTVLLSLAIGFAIGCYDGLIGPGTGTFLILAFTTVLGYDLLVSSGCAKVANAASNTSSMIVYFLNGKVLLPVGLIAALFSIAGSQLGSRMAIRGGAKIVRVLIFFVLGLLIVKTLAGFLA